MKNCQFVQILNEMIDGNFWDFAPTKYGLPMAGIEIKGKNKLKYCDVRIFICCFIIRHWHFFIQSSKIKSNMFRDDNLANELHKFSTQQNIWFSIRIYSDGYFSSIFTALDLSQVAFWISTLPTFLIVKINAISLTSE